MTATEIDDLKDQFRRRESKFEGNTFGGLEYSWWLAGPGGADYLFWVPEGAPAEQIKEAKAACRRSQDVVSIHVQRIPQVWLDEEHFVPGERRPWIESVRLITVTHGFRRIDTTSHEVVPHDKTGGQAIDLTTANMLCQVYDKLNPANQKKFGEMDLLVAIDIGWKLVAKQRERNEHEQQI